MATSTTHPPAVAERDQAPPDLATMRETVNRLLDPDAVPGVLPPSGAELETLTTTVRGHLELLIPEVETAAGKLGKESIPGYGARRCVWEARSRLQAEPNPRYGGPAGYARRLARSLNALCDYYEAFGGGRP